MLRADVDCLCEAFKSSAQFGVVWNITKVVALHTTCRFSSPFVFNYGRQSSHSSLSFSALLFFIFYFWKILSVGKLVLLEFQQEIFFVVIDGSFVFS